MKAPTKQPITARVRQCEGKKRCATRGEATWHKQHLKSDRGEKHLNVYYCKYCHGWHVGHVNKGGW